MIDGNRCRDYLQRMSLYDLLLRIQKNWNSKCLIEALGEWKECNHNCEKCIQEWLNQENI